MGILTTLLERRGSLENPAVSLSTTNWPGDGYQTTAGVPITHESALTIAAVYAAVRIASESIASLPLILYRRLERGRERATGSRLYRVLHDRPNPEMSAYVFRETLQGHVETWGNAYCELELRGDGGVEWLWPLQPDRTYPERKNGVKVYHTRLPGGQMVTLPSNRVMHVPGFGFDGLVGKSPVTLARESFGLTKGAESFGAAWFGNGARVAGVLSHPSVVSPDARKRMKEDWDVLHRGIGNAHRVAILEEGVQWHQIGIPPNDSQFLETRRFQVQEVARWFRIPLHMLADNSMAPASNVEQAALDFVMHSMRPRAIRWEQAVNWDVVPQGSLYAEFLLTALLRGDNASRSQYYRELFNIGALSLNEIRESENQNPVEGGDTHFVPLNMVPLAQAVEGPGADEPDDDGSRASRLRAMEARLASVYRPLFRDVAGRVLARELSAARRARKKGAAAVRAWVPEFYAAHEMHIRQQLAPVIAAYARAAEPMIGRSAAEALPVMACQVAEAWCATSRSALATALDAGNPEAALDDLLAEWEAGRADGVAEAILLAAARTCLHEALTAGEPAEGGV